METFTNTAEILGHLKNRHRELQDLYRRSREQVHGERVKMLFDSAGRHQKETIEAIARFEQQASAEQLEAHFQYTPGALDEKRFDSAAIGPDMTVDDAARLIAEHLSELAVTYGRLAEMSAFVTVAEIFRSLEHQLRAMRDRLAQSSQQLKDI